MERRPAWGASALTAFAADCAVWTNEAFGQSLLARGLTLTGDAAAAAAALPQPAGLNPVEIDQLRQARRRTVFLDEQTAGSRWNAGPPKRSFWLNSCFAACGSAESCEGDTPMSRLRNPLISGPQE